MYPRALPYLSSVNLHLISLIFSPTSPLRLHPSMTAYYSYINPLFLQHTHFFLLLTGRLIASPSQPTVEYDAAPHQTGHAAGLEYMLSGQLPLPSAATVPGHSLVSAA